MKNMLPNMIFRLLLSVTFSVVYAIAFLGYDLKIIAFFAFLSCWFPFWHTCKFEINSGICKSFWLSNIFWPVVLGFFTGMISAKFINAFPSFNSGVLGALFLFLFFNVIDFSLYFTRRKKKIYKVIVLIVALSLSSYIASYFVFALWFSGARILCFG